MSSSRPAYIASPVCEIFSLAACLSRTLAAILAAEATELVKGISEGEANDPEAILSEQDLERILDRTDAAYEAAVDEAKAGGKKDEKFRVVEEEGADTIGLLDGLSG